MATQIIYFPTRDAARKHAAEVGGKLHDAGSDARKGERWGVITTLVSNVVNVSLGIDIEPKDLIGVPSVKTLAMPAAHRSNIAGEQVLKGRYNNPVTVRTKRSTQAAKAAWLADYNAM